MDNLNLPKELIAKCYQIAIGARRTRETSDIAKIITSNKFILVLSSINDGFTFLRFVNAIFKIRIIAWIIMALLVIATFILSKWMILGAIALFVGDRYIAKWEKDSWASLSALLLTAEMLINDFAGWGTAFPNEQKAVIKLYDDFSIIPRTLWLDYYLENRNEIGSEIILAFGPNNGN